jgi:hypothetical protein
MRISTKDAMAGAKIRAAVIAARNAIDRDELERLPIGLAKEDR